MQSIKNGENIQINKSLLHGNEVIISFSWSIIDLKSINVDIFCIKTDKRSNVIDELDFIYRNNRQAQDGSIQCSGISSFNSLNSENFLIRLTKLRENIHKIVFIGATNIKNKFNELKNFDITLYNNKYEVIVQYKPINDANFSVNSLCEVYRRYNSWKFRAITIGYQGGIQDFLETYGYKVG